MTEPTPVPNDIGGDSARAVGQAGRRVENGSQVTTQLADENPRPGDASAGSAPGSVADTHHAIPHPGGEREPGSGASPGDERADSAGTGASEGDESGEGETAIQALWREFTTSPSQRVRDRLVLHYAPLVKYVAGRVGTGLPAHVDVADLIQSGIFGLVDAIEKFDPERGLRFETYAMQRIRGAILDDLRSQDWVPRVVRSRAREAERAIDRLEARLRRTPTDAELAAELGITLDELRDLYGQLQLTSVVALEDLVAAGRDSGSLVDSLPDEDAVDPAAVLVDRDNRRQLAEAIAQLTERDRVVVSLYYFESLTLAEIGKVLGVTESRVSQLHTRAVLRLRAKLQEQATV
ncbi:FliA/WhiG family RNA polymerase sigma factor [Prauserella muralis]|uniref:FliA/WhiG family RNA polymerase sigma factor n=1 Tax=Prauserella muralis TaxID=588067 RepID=UPI0011ACEE20|nr:FliA/WhiG family RNA polymerase sigma factor [Prauserella muralis]TWE23203.1 RNA polymerase sigma-28 (SigD/FliA/WhiG) subunit [Prauserella muralis]